MTKRLHFLSFFINIWLFLLHEGWKQQTAHFHNGGPKPLCLGTESSVSSGQVLLKDSRAGRQAPPEQRGLSRVRLSLKSKPWRLQTGVTGQATRDTGDAGLSLGAVLRWQWSTVPASEDRTPVSRAGGNTHSSTLKMRSGDHGLVCTQALTNPRYLIDDHIVEEDSQPEPSIRLPSQTNSCKFWARIQRQIYQRYVTSYPSREQQSERQIIKTWM